MHACVREKLARLAEDLSKNLCMHAQGDFGQLRIIRKKMF